MSGYWDYKDRPWTFDYVEGKRQATESDVRIELTISATGPDRPADRILRFHDARLFGSLRFYPTWELESIPSLKNLGPEFLETDHTFPRIPPMNRNTFDNGANNFKKSIKELLMTQEFGTGIGNIYAAESLFDAKIDPRRPAKSLSESEIMHLHGSTYFTLKQALKSNCDYTNLKVYRRKSCQKCLGEIKMEKLAGRSTYFCPNCQV
jgi:formamidopyrimidine-DNA glycosylase